MQEIGCVHNSIDIITATEGRGPFVQEDASCPARAKQPEVIQRAATARSQGKGSGQEAAWFFETSPCIAPACSHNGGAV